MHVVHVLSSNWLLARTAGKPWVVVPAVQAVSGGFTKLLKMGWPDKCERTQAVLLRARRKLSWPQTNRGWFLHPVRFLGGPQLPVVAVLVALGPRAMHWFLRCVQVLQHAPKRKWTKVIGCFAVSGGFLVWGVGVDPGVPSASKLHFRFSLLFQGW